MDTVSFGLFLFVCFLLVVAALAIVLDFLPNEKRLKEQIAQQQETILNLQKQIADLSSKLTQQGNTAESSISTLQEEYEEYKNNGGTLDLLSFGLAQDDHLRFP